MSDSDVLTGELPIYNPVDLSHSLVLCRRPLVTSATSSAFAPGAPHWVLGYWPQAKESKDETPSVWPFPNSAQAASTLGLEVPRLLQQCAFRPALAKALMQNLPPSLGDLLRSPITFTHLHPNTRVVFVSLFFFFILLLFIYLLIY